MKKIAFCFLIYDEILNEDLWYKFFHGIDKEKYNIYIHYKEHKPLKYFEEYKIFPTRCVKTNYADITLVYAHRRLFEEAFLDKDNYKFINISQSCIPVKSFDYIYDFLTKDNNSHFTECYKDACWPRVKPATKYISRENIYKSTNWFILNREHTRLVLDNVHKEYMFMNVYSPEEHYFITLVKNKLNENVIYIQENKEDSITFTNWKEKGKNNKLPKHYDEITNEELQKLLNSKSLFARKFEKNVIVKVKLEDMLNF